MSVEVEGLDAFARDLGSAGSAARDAALDAGRRGAERIADDMRRRVAVRSGGLRATIRTEVSADGASLLRVGGTAGTTAAGDFDQALAVEYGNRHSRAQPFVYPAIEAARAGVEGEMSEAADRAAGEVFQ